MFPYFFVTIRYEKICLFLCLCADDRFYGCAESESFKGIVFH